MNLFDNYCEIIYALEFMKFFIELYISINIFLILKIFKGEKRPWSVIYGYNKKINLYNFSLN